MHKFDEQYKCNEDELGVAYSNTMTKFCLWAPNAEDVMVQIFENDKVEKCFECKGLERRVDGSWVLLWIGDLENKYYSFLVTYKGNTVETLDPYVKAVGTNGKRGMIIDFQKTNPDGFEREEKLPALSWNESVIYEAHIRDLSMDCSCEIPKEMRGKFNALALEGLTNSKGDKIALDHLVELGITHLHLLPVYDYGSVDESRPDLMQFNWGYDPVNYNCIEGSYSTNPEDGRVRIKEFKNLIMKLHQKGIRVVLDVVYNHTYQATGSSFENMVPGYYYRMDGEKFSDASGCGNEVASEHVMMRKFIVESILFFVKEYHVDGFRFDLMGILDLETMNQIRREVNRINPSILLYGEGWTCNTSTLDETYRAVKIHTKQMPGIASFNDDFRDGVKGNCFKPLDQGFVNGKGKNKNEIKFGVVGATKHPQVEYVGGLVPWTNKASQSINYVSCHDNFTLWDKFAMSNEKDSREIRIRMNKLAAAIVFTAQGIPFFHSGEEFLRCKRDEDGNIIENSYNESDEINCLKWINKTENRDVFLYYKGLIEMRKAHRVFHLDEQEEISRKLKFLDKEDDKHIFYEINDENKYLVIYNSDTKKVPITLPSGNWQVLVNHEQAGCDAIEVVCHSVMIEALSAMVLKEM